MNRPIYRTRLVMSAFRLALLLSFWLVARGQHSFAAMQQPIAPVTMDLRRKLRRDIPLYVIEWVMPARYRRALRLSAV
jgi:hypothetical protein